MSVKFPRGTCMYQKQQPEKPLSVTDIFRQQSEMGAKEQPCGALATRRAGLKWGGRNAMVRMVKGNLFVCWLLNVPATCKCISGTDLLRQFYVLPH